jgi:hypothetical protein
VLGGLLLRVDAEVRAYLGETRLSALAALRLDGSPAPSSGKPSGRAVAPEQQVRRARTGR